MKLIILLVLFSTIVFSGERGGNGGGVHVCENNVELYDFYEARNPRLHNLPVWKSIPEVSLEAYLEKALAHIQKDIPSISNRVKAQLNKILEIPKDQLIINQGIPLILDADIPMTDEGCDYDQVANWNNRFERVFFRKKYYDLMDNMNKAGLYIHETLYKLSRDSAISHNSDKIRKVVGKIFSDELLTKDDELTIWSEDALMTKGGSYCTDAINLASDNMRLMSRLVDLCRSSKDNPVEMIRFRGMRNQLIANLKGSAELCKQRCYSETQLELCPQFIDMADLYERKVCL